MMVSETTGNKSLREQTYGIFRLPFEEEKNDVSIFL